MGALSIPASFSFAKPVDAFSVEDEEDRQYEEDVAAVKSWWADSRWRYTKRPYTAEDIVAKRGNLCIEYPSNVQAKKLWSIVEQRFNVRFCSVL